MMIWFEWMLKGRAPYVYGNLHIKPHTPTAYCVLTMQSITKCNLQICMYYI